MLTISPFFGCLHYHVHAGLAVVDDSKSREENVAGQLLEQHLAGRVRGEVH